MKIFSAIPGLFSSRQERVPPPKRVFWWLPQRCNLRCNHCYIGKKTQSSPMPASPLTIEDKKRIINTLQTWIGSRYSLSFIAGEPLMHPDLLELIKYAHTHGAITSFTSNGSLIVSETIAEKIVRSGLDFIALSIDSCSAKIHDESRGVAGVHKRAMQAIEYVMTVRRRLKVGHPRIYANSIIMRNNLKELIDLVQWAKDRRIDGITFQPIAASEFFGGDTACRDDWFKTSDLWPDYPEVNRFVGQLETLQQQGYPIRNSANDFRRFRDYFADPVAFARKESCMGDLSSMTITETGDIKICPSLPGIGSIFHGDLDRLWSSTAADAGRRQITHCTAQCKILACNKEDFYF